MDKRTLKALKGSIRKWRLIANGTGEDHGYKNCPLCKLFFNKDCIGCPVRRKTDRGYCEGTPYTRWDSFRNQSGKATTQHLRKLAKAELDFLKTLLPK